jgi:FlaA1/EpsC-like NDP-sugar epimerase
MTNLTNWRAWLAFGHDLAAIALAWVGAYWLRFNLDLREPFVADLAWMLAWIVPLQGAIFLAFGLYRGLWRFASIVDLQRIMLAAGLGALLVPLALVMLQLQAVVPRSVLLFYPLVLIFVMAGSRFAYRSWKEHRLYSPFAALGEPVLVIGAGERGAADHGVRAEPQWRVVGLLDDDPAKQGRLLRNIGVLGPIASLPTWAKKFGVRKVIIALPSAALGVRRRVAEICADIGLEALTVPSYEELINGSSALTTIRTIELDDLLGRDPVA